MIAENPVYVIKLSFHYLRTVYRLFLELFDVKCFLDSLVLTAIETLLARRNTFSLAVDTIFSEALQHCNSRSNFLA